MKTRLLFAKLFILFFLVLNLIHFKGNAQDGQNDASFNPYDNIASQGTDNIVRLSIVQPDNKILITGEFTQYNGTTAKSLARLNTDGKIDKNFSSGSGTDGNILAITLQYNNKILIGGDFTSYNGFSVNKIARLNTNGSIDKTFKVGTGANNSITKILVQPDEKILVAGNFTVYNDVPAKGLVRLNKNGTVDQTFNAALTDSLVNIHQIAVLSNGKIIITGRAHNFFGDMRNFIETLRLYKNGNRDYSFQECKFSVGDLYPTINSIGIESDGNLLLAGTNWDGGSSVPYHGLLIRVNGKGEIIQRQGSFWINSMQVQPDQKIMALGFDNMDWGIIKRKVVRMNKDLTIDSSFVLKDDKIYEDPSQSAIQSLSIQLDGKLIIAGNFYEINGLIANNIARLNTDGSFDVTFNQRRGCNGAVFTTAKQTNGRLIIGGEFSRYNYKSMPNIARLKNNGDLDPTFYAGSGTNGKIYSIAIQSDGKILIGGSFTTYNKNTCSNIARLNTDGSFDNTFIAKADDIVRKIVVYADDRILIGGDFRNVNETAHVAAARLEKNGLLETGFHPVIEDIGCVYDCKLTNEGKIYLALNYKNTPEFWIDSRIERLNSDGTLDPSFQIPASLLFKINSIVLTDDHKVLAGGLGYYAEPWFYLPQGIITRLNEDGSADSAFKYKTLKPFLNKEVRTIQVIAANKILIGGDFDADPLHMNHIGLVKDDGNIQTSFVGYTNGNVYSSMIVEENKLVIGGTFSSYASVVRNGIARISFDPVVPDLQRTFGNEQLEEAERKMEIRLYPNPAATFITIDHMQEGNIFKIYNTSGIELYAGKIQNSRSEIDISAYANGIYFLIAEENGKKIQKKFIVSR